MVKASIFATCGLVAAIAAAGCSGPGATTPDGATTSTADATSAPVTSSTGTADTHPSSSSGGGDQKMAEGAQATEVSGAAFVMGDGPKTLADAKGKVVILDFWGTYCEPCKESFPKYQAMKDQFGADLVIIAVSEDDADTKPDDIKKFADKAKAKFTILWDKDGAVGKKYKPEKMPTSYVIDKDGKISKIHSGFNSGDEKKIAADVKALLGK